MRDEQDMDGGFRVKIFNRDERRIGVKDEVWKRAWMVEIGSQTVSTWEGRNGCGA